MSLIRLPEFVKEEDVQWAKEQVKIKKKIDTSHIQFYTYHEGLCVQCLHLGAFNDEPQTVAKMHDYMIKMGYQLDISEKRFHHEIYLNASKQIVPDKMKTIIRHPIKKRGA